MIFSMEKGWIPMNIFFRELKANRKSLVIWSVCMALGVLSGMSKYTAYSGDNANNSVLNELPRAFRALLGMGDFDVTKMSGFFAFLFLYLELAAAAHAVLLGSGILAKEERGKTAEFLAAKPVSRSAIITSKLCAALVNLLVLDAVILISSIAMAAAYNKGPEINGEIVLFVLSLFLVQLIFVSMGTLFAAALKKPKLAGPAAAGVMVGSFVVSEITNLTDRLDALKVLSPFQYFSYSGIVRGDGLDPLAVSLSLALAAFLLWLTYFCYRRRDLNV